METDLRRGKVPGTKVLFFPPATNTAWYKRFTTLVLISVNEERNKHDKYLICEEPWRAMIYPKALSFVALRKETKMERTSLTGVPEGKGLSSVFIV